MLSGRGLVRWLRAGSVLLISAATLISITGPAFADVPTCFGRRATKVGTQGNDRLFGTRGTDVIVGLGGNDYINDGGGNDFVCGGRGRDRLISGGGAEHMAGGPGDDYLSGGSGPNLLRGGDGNDFLNPHRFGGRYEGGRGFDVATFFQVECRVIANLSTQVGTWRCSDYAGRARLIGIEGLWGTRFADRLIGNYKNNELFGERGADQIRGGSGDDLLIGDLGNDGLDGGPGQDTAWYAHIPRAVTVDLGAGTATGQGADKLTAIEDIYGSPLNDILRGDRGANSLHGRSGNDTILGREGDDQLVGEAGTDPMDGGDGIDDCVTDAADPPPVACEGPL
jgi:Ca2+-binding RTX toxin-like protein